MLHNSREILSKFVIGQTHWISTMVVLMDSMADGDPNNILIVGPSGYGKTFIGTLMLNYAFRYVRKEETQIVNCGDRFELPNKSGILYDEAHLIETPESLYRFMDSKQHSIIFTTNYWQLLTEPLKNRCIQIQLSKYTFTDLVNIVTRTFIDNNIEINNDIIYEIARRCRNTPRIAVEISKLFGKFSEKNPVSNVNDTLNSLGIFENGLRTFDLEYLDAIKSLGGQASLTRIEGLTGFPRLFIETQIEPLLLELNLIEITGRGRHVRNYSKI